MKRGAPPRSGVAVAALLLLTSCATTPGLGPGGPSAPALDSAGVRRALLGRNEGLGELRAVVEARISFAGRRASFPGVLVLRSRGAFRLDLLDPLDRPLAIVFQEDRRLVQYRPAEGYAASLAAFPEGCRDLDPGEWAAPIVSDLPELPVGEGVRHWSFWGRNTLEVERRGVLRQSIVYGEVRGGELRPSKVSWYCGDDVVMQLRIRSWKPDGEWRIPERFEVSWPRASLAVSVQVRDVFPGAGEESAPLVPRLGPETRWTVWNLPQ